ncbi:hypothetical protein BOTBODRAFT_51285 [Botryobasidium botryosum FD-172 SS1]|uniref:Protein kinase domain-containing protein n=1 Tax=Botryobasidium botryosum (strain FD-172 SS1) TaxID=930990 RepID=A0A067MWD6_BOTB1|nr:hypothetical protein BOTBODRAFT_51285 [Botryobasidium botryosum FD-172 SS1]
MEPAPEVSVPLASPSSSLSDGFGISESEHFWVSRQPFFESQGYLLRPRYHPGWKRSWDTDIPPYDAEDGITPTCRPEKIMDATRIQDGLVVILKRVKRGGDEVDIMRYLSQDAFRSDKRNHCVPLLDVLDPGAGDDAFVVLPLLRKFDDPKFESIKDAVEFIKQMLQGLVFIHENGVAHRDCGRWNIMMDASKLYPQGFHPQRPNLSIDAQGPAKARRRASAPQPKYYFIDFDLSSRFDDATAPRLVTGRHCQDRTAPELSDRVPYDPFKLDVYILGNVFHRCLLSKYNSLAFLSPLVNRMISRTPDQRPSAPDALAEFRECMRSLSCLALHRRLVTPIPESFSKRLAQNGVHLVRYLKSTGQSFMCCM